MALWDNDHVLGNPCVGNVLQRSSAIMRSTVLPALPPGLKAGTQADKRLRIVFGDAGPMVVNAETLAAELATRRVGNAYYSLGFAHTLFQQALLAKGSIKETTRAVAAHFVNQGSELVSLLPRDTDNSRSCWEAMLADVFFSPAADNLLRQLLDRCHHHSEFRSLSTDCTFRMMFSLFGQASYRAPKVVRADQALDEQEARHALFTVRLFSGPVVCATAIYMENTDCMIRVLESELSEEHRLQVVHVSNDDPSPKLLRGLKRIMRNHEVLSMDPMHPAFTYEQAQGRKKTPGSTLLRRILCRIVARDSQGPSGPYYDGSSKPQATDEEITLLQAIEDCSMPEREAKRLAADLFEIEALTNRLEIVRHVAALCSLFPEEVNRTAFDGRKLFLVLRTTFAPGRLEWLLNFPRYLHSLDGHEKAFLATGTTTNESLHRELNNTFDDVHGMYQATLDLKLRMFKFGKLMPVVRAMDSDMLRSIGEQMMMHRLVHSVVLWSMGEWREWCGESGVLEGALNGSVIKKACVPLMDQRMDHARRVRIWKKTKASMQPTLTKEQVLKRPAAAIVMLPSGKPGTKKLTRYTKFHSTARVLKRPTHFVAS